MKDYCHSDHYIDCEFCSLSSYGKDCQNNPIVSEEDLKDYNEQITKES